MTDAKKDIIIQVEIANTIYSEITELKKQLATIAPTAKIPVTLDLTGIQNQDLSKLLPAGGTTLNIKSVLDKGFALTIKTVKQALRNLHTDATIPIKIAPLDANALSGMTKVDWAQLSPPPEVSNSINTLNKALSSLGTRLNSRKLGKGAGATTKSLAQIINETADAFKNMSGAAAQAAGAVGAIKTTGIASDPTKARGGKGGKSSEFDITTFSRDEQQFYLAQKKLIGDNAREVENLNKFMSANAGLRQKMALTGEAGLNNISGMKDMGGLKGAMSRVLLFGSATSLLYGGIASMRKAIDITIDLENEMVQLQKVMSDTTPFEEMKAQMFDLSETMGVSILQVTRLAKIWAQQGYDMVGVMKLATVTLDTMNALSVSEGQATDFLTSVTRVWGVELNELQKTLSSVMRVQADYAIESEDLATILTRIGSGVREAGDSMAFLAGASTALRESTRKTASQIFTSLKTIYAKSFSSEVIESLKNVGIYAKSSADTFRPFSDVLTELAGKWKTLSDVERKSLAITIGQTRYWSDFVALMENFGTVQSATLSFYRAWDDASKASELQQQSLLNVLKGVGSSFAKMGDTFGTKFFTPFVKALSGPIKAFADIFSKLGGAQSAIVFAASLAILRSALKNVFGVFPAYEKFLGRAGLAGMSFAKSVVAQRAAIMGSISAGTAYGKTVRYIANHLQLLTGTAGTATRAVTTLSVVMARSTAILKLAGTAAVNFGKSLLSFGLWTAAFYALDFVISKIAGSFKSAQTEAEEFAAAFPVDVIEKINSIGLKDKNGFGVSSFMEIKTTLDSLIPLLIKKQRELSTPVDDYILKWKDVQEVIDKMSSNEIAVLKKNYKDLTTNVETQKKFWEDIQTTMAIIENFTFGDTRKKAEELKTTGSQDFAKASGASEMLRKRLIDITNLRLNDVDDLYGDKFRAAIFKNIREITEDPIIKQALIDLKEALGGKGDANLWSELFSFEVSSPLYNSNSDRFKKLTDKLANDLAFGFLDAQDQITRFLESHPLNLEKGMTMADIPVDKLIDPQLLTMKIGEGISIYQKKVDEELNRATKRYGAGIGIKEMNALKGVATEGEEVDLGKLFQESAGKARKAATSLKSDLDKIRLLYKNGGIFPEDILQEQQKAYKNFQTEIISEYRAANDEMEALATKRAGIVATIMADPSRPKDFDPANPKFEQIVSNLEKLYNSSSNEGEKAATANNPVLAANLKLLKQTLDAQNDNALNVAEMTAAYNNLEPVNKILGKINYQLEQQAIIEKIIKSSREFNAKQSIEYLKAEAQLQEDVARTVISSQRSYFESQGNQFKKLEEIKQKELALHRRVAIRKSEIDVIEQKKTLQNSTKILPFMLPTRTLGGLVGLWNQGVEKRKADLSTQLDQLDEHGEKMKVIVNLQEDMFASSSNIADFYSIWIDHLNSVSERSSFIRNTLADSITDFARINETHGLSVLTDTIGKIGKRFQEEQAKIFVNSVINSKLGGFVLPSEEDIKFTERLAATSDAFYSSVYGAMHAGALEISQAMGVPFAMPPQEFRDRAKAEQEAAALSDTKKAGNIAAIGNLASMFGLSFIGGNQQNKQRGSEIGSILGAVLPKLLIGANPIVGAISSVVGLFGGGVIGSLFGGGNEQKQDTMIGQLKLIEQNTARVADLTEKLINIPGSVFLPPTGGFVMNGSIVINANGISNPQQVVDMTVSQLSREFGLSARRSGARGNFNI